MTLRHMILSMLVGFGLATALIALGVPWPLRAGLYLASGLAVGVWTIWWEARNS